MSRGTQAKRRSMGFSPCNVAAASSRRTLSKLFLGCFEQAFHVAKEVLAEYLNPFAEAGSLRSLSKLFLGCFEQAFHVATEVLAEYLKPFAEAGSLRYVAWASARATKHFEHAVVMRCQTSH